MAATEEGSALVGLETYIKNLESFQERQMGIQETQVEILKELMASRAVQNDLLERQDKRIEQQNERHIRENQKANEERFRQLEIAIGNLDKRLVKVEVTVEHIDERVIQY